MSELTIRSYEPRDISAIIALESACARAPQWGKAFWRTNFLNDAARRGVFVSEIDEQVCGYLVVSYAVEIAELESVAVGESARHSGVGQALCEHAMQWARGQGAKTMELEVRESNATAVALYRRLGFVEQGKRVKFYRDPIEDAVLMAAKL